MKKRLLTTMLALATLTAGAQEENVKMRFDFSDVSGTTVTDVASGVAAKLMNEAKVTTMGDYHVLDLGSGTGYLDMTAEAGKVFAACEDHTISVYYYVKEQASLSGNGYFLWAFSTLDACTATDGIYSAYRLNAQRIASSTGGYTNEKGGDLTTASDKGRWMHVAYTQSGAKGQLYIDGKLKKTISSMPLNSALYGSLTPSICWIGRAPFSADNYLTQTLVTDFRLYDCALTADEVATLAAETEAMDEAYLFGTTGDTEQLQQAVAEGKSLLGGTANYLPDALESLKDMVEMAETVIAGAYSQTYIDKVYAQLTETIAQVKRTQGAVLPTADDLTEAYDTDRGFIHPGGLHTQADFDRIRQQLANKNAKVTEAYEVLKNAEYAQPGVATWPVETIIRGGGVGENYINAARGATMAYQNALRWKIEDNKACANAAVRILMAWANTTKGIGGDSNYALAAGLYGYQFAQAAELMRDYEGWSREDFATFKRWMLDVWYPSAIGFLRGRNGTWENTSKWWQAPGHYWSNWGLCNVMCVISIGILCDDVYIYNQGMSYYKYDQCGTYTHPRTLHDVTGHEGLEGTQAILNDGLTEFLGNLVVTTAESSLETGAYGELGQMNESGRDTGHSAMALGLAVDVAKVGWNQGDDLFSYMDHRLAAGIEYVAAQTQSVANLPWTNYIYATNGYYYHDYRSWVMQGPALGAQTRPYWGTVIGHYEGVKGVKMPYSETSYNVMGIDGGGLGSTSGGYDHMGYSVLMNTRDTQLCPADQVPTELSPKMEYSGEWNSNLVPSMNVEQTLGNLSGKEFAHSELGGLVNTFVVNTATCVPRGETVKLMPQLPDGEEDTGLWEWETGETTRNITVTTDRSRLYRVTYTNGNGVKSQQCFAIAVENDCEPTPVKASVTYGGKTYSTDTIDVVYGETATLTAIPACGWGTYQWSTGETTQSITTAPVIRERDYTVYYTNQGSALSSRTFHVNVIPAAPYITTASGTAMEKECLVSAGSEVTLGLTLSPTVPASSVTWSTGDEGSKVTLTDLQTSSTYTATFTFEGKTVSITFNVLVQGTEDATLTPGCYLICHAATGRLLTAHSEEEICTLEEGDPAAPTALQIWSIDNKKTRHCLTALPDSLPLYTNGKLGSVAVYAFYVEQAVGADRIVFRSGTTTSSRKYWNVEEDGTLTTDNADFPGYPFQLIPVDPALGITETTYNKEGDSLLTPDAVVYDLQGRRVNPTRLERGVYIVNGKKMIKK